MPEWFEFYVNIGDDNRWIGLTGSLMWERKVDEVGFGECDGADPVEQGGKGGGVVGVWSSFEHLHWRWRHVVQHPLQCYTYK